MTPNEYQREAIKTISPDSTLAALTLGLCGESGEVAEHIKKHLAHGQELDDVTICQELGDCLWYIAAIAYANNISLLNVMNENICKLRRRHPNGTFDKAYHNDAP